MSSYKTTVTSGSQSTVTFASFGLYELEDGDNWSYEIDSDARMALTTRVSSGEEAQTNASPTTPAPSPNPTQETELPPQRPEVPKLHTDPPVTQPPAHASRLVKKILARPPSFSGPPGPPIPMKFMTLASIAGDTDSVDAENMSSDESSSSDSGRSTRGTSSGSTYSPPPIVSDGPMRFPF
ncbi:hypothetical protein BT96DRAFT_925473 [Gymnopus androsaceus JB14]|uniref:Uncharacterized protein n=1 Tax=Gymnopus androsaceus JB14 TaxID=1447944 RepID=A0A6A4GYW5_9AGAR|nr:hypothetical protein BT96DRAFT_925473 [Gymnopus androsaceus JB14]